MTICWKCTHPQAIEDVDEFVSSSEQILINLALHHMLTNGSSAVNGCHQNEIQTANKNIIIIHKTPVHQLMSCEVKKRKKIQNIYFSSEKNHISSELGEKYAQINHVHEKTVQNSSK